MLGGKRKNMMDGQTKKERWTEEKNYIKGEEQVGEQERKTK